MLNGLCVLCTLGLKANDTAALNVSQCIYREYFIVENRFIEWLGEKAKGVG